MAVEKIIGILGGMGPYTTIDMFRRLVDLTPALKDWEHLRIIVDNNPKIPSRSRALLYGEASPAPMMTETARNLERAGADFIVLPCNTSHHWFAELQASVSIPILNIIEETVARVAADMPEVEQVGLLATAVTAQGALYRDAFAAKGFRVVVPDDGDQSLVNDVIEAVKLGDTGADTRAKLLGVAVRLVAEGAQVLVIGCTEISIVAEEGDFPVAAFDSSEILAQAAVDLALGREQLDGLKEGEEAG